jgi:2'-5' RNA ligase/NTP pyrophosphatase (non-canonical NTP hydrolase)
MAIGICLRFDADSDARIRALWRLLDGQGTPSLTTLGYAPHITLTAHEELDTDAAAHVLRRLARNLAPIPVNVVGPAVFPGDVNTLWLALAAPASLLNLHDRVANQVGLGSCHPFYRPGAWIPHCTLAQGIPGGPEMKRAMQTVGDGFGFFRGAFTRLEVVSTDPIDILWGFDLEGSKTQIDAAPAGMGLDAYVEQVAAVVNIVAGKPVSNEKLAYVALGLAGESGEVADDIKKVLRDGTSDLSGAADELGDVIYYWACMCVICGRTPSDILRASAEKVERKLGGRTIVPGDRKR